MSLSSSMKYLSERGVVVTEISPDRFSLHVEGNRHSTLAESSEGILFSCWDSAPGPGKDDFLVSFVELDDALLAVWYFYFGEPVRLGEWLVPIHRHPYWSLGKLAYRIANAIHVTSRQFETTEEQRQGDLLGFGSSAGGRPLSEDRYATALRSQFIAGLLEAERQWCSDHSPFTTASHLLSRDVSRRRNRAAVDHMLSPGDGRCPV
jgi:hypothetical protein